MLGRSLAPKRGKDLKVQRVNWPILFSFLTLLILFSASSFAAEVLTDAPSYLIGATVDIDGLAFGSDELDVEGIAWSDLGPGNFPYRLRQDPGPANALGRMKFVFPNRFSVYLHDTPVRGSFVDSARARSHGCA